MEKKVTKQLSDANPKAIEIELKLLNSFQNSNLIFFENKAKNYKTVNQISGKLLKI